MIKIGKRVDHWDIDFKIKNQLVTNLYNFRFVLMLGCFKAGFH